MDYFIHWWTMELAIVMGTTNRLFHEMITATQNKREFKEFTFPWISNKYCIDIKWLTVS